MDTIAKVVARFRDGRVLKGFTQSFDPNKPTFRMHPAHDDPGTEAVPIDVADLKAVFFVRDFEGNREYNEHKAFTKRPAGRIIEVTFFDGETLVGTSLTYDASRPGFFLFPADPQSNNERIFIIRAATTSIKPIPPALVQLAPPR